MEKVLNQVKEQHAIQTQEKEILQRSLLDSQKKIGDLSALLQAEGTEKIRLHEQIYGLERQCTQQTEETARLHKILTQTQNNLEHYQAANLKLKETHSIERDNERNQYLQSMRSLESNLNTLAQEKAALEANFLHANNAHENANKIIAQVQENRTTLESELSESKTQRALLEQNNQVLSQQLSKQDEQCKKISDQLHVAFEQINLLNYKNVELSASLLKAEDETKALTDEKIFLIQEKSEMAGQLKLFQSKNSG